MKIGEQTLADLLRDVFEVTKTGQGALTSLNALFRAKGLHGRLLAVIFAHVPELHAQLTVTSVLARHRLEDTVVADLTAHQFRALLAHYYAHSIRTLESETWPVEFTQGMDPGFVEHFREIRDRELVEMAATMVELATGSPSARKVTAAHAQWEHLSLEMRRVLAGKGISFLGTGLAAGPPDVITRVRMAFILTLLSEETQSEQASTLHAYLRQIQDLGDCGVEARLIGRMWFLPSEIPHNTVGRREDDSPRGLDFTSLQAIVGRWRGLLRASYPHEVTVQLCAGNWNSALRFLKGHTHLLCSLKSQILEMVRLQMPFVEILKESAGQQHLSLPFGMEAVFREGHLPMQMAVGSEILTLLGSQAGYPLLFIWQEPERKTGCLEIVDACPEKAPANGAPHNMAVEMVLLRVFRQAWGIPGPSSAEDFSNPARLLETAPCGIEVEAGIVTEIQEALDLLTMSAVLTRVENVLDRITQQLPQQSGENVKKNVCGLRRLIKRAGVRKKNGSHLSHIGC